MAGLHVPRLTIAHAAKILLKIIKKIITPITESKVSESQPGFRKVKGTREAIYMTRILTERALRKEENYLPLFY